MKPMRIFLVGAAGLAALCASAQAQTYYGGYNLGPDYGAMVQQQLQQMQRQDMQMQSTAGQIARQAEERNRAAETQKLHELRRAEQMRGQAQQGYMDSLQRNNSEFGVVLGGGNTWIASTGAPVALQHTQPGVPTADPSTGATHAMDAMGRHHALTPYGTWVPMQMAR